MRVIRDRNYKLIWNIASPLPYPFASDLWAASTWQAQLAKGMDAPYGLHTVRDYIHRENTITCEDIRKNQKEYIWRCDPTKVAHALSQLDPDQKQV